MVRRASSRTTPKARSNAWNRGRQTADRFARHRRPVTDTVLARRHVRRAPAEYAADRTGLSSGRAATARVARPARGTRRVHAGAGRVRDGASGVAERASRPQWLTVGAHAAIGREVRASRCRAGRARAKSGVEAGDGGRAGRESRSTSPRRDVGFLRGVSRVSGAWERQTYTAAHRPAHSRNARRRRPSRQRTGSLPTSGMRLSAGIDSWNERGERRRSSGAAAAVFRRSRSRSRRAENSSHGVSDGPRLLHCVVSGASHIATRHGFRAHGRRRIDAASTHAPLALWPGAGDGMARPYLLRAHPLLVDDIVSGPAFGRTLLHLTAESTRWLVDTATGSTRHRGVRGCGGRVQPSRRHRPRDARRCRRRHPVASSWRRQRDGAGGLRCGVRDGRQRVSVGIVADRF